MQCPLFCRTSGHKTSDRPAASMYCLFQVFGPVILFTTMAFCRNIHDTGGWTQDWHQNVPVPLLYIGFSGKDAWPTHGLTMSFSWISLVHKVGLQKLLC